jgi:hypothetical protein
MQQRKQQDAGTAAQRSEDADQAAAALQQLQQQLGEHKEELARLGTHFTCFTGTNVQILTQGEARAPRHSVYLLYLIAKILVQKYKY